jgi:hypothetical protein
MSFMAMLTGAIAQRFLNPPANPAPGDGPSGSEP